MKFVFLTLSIILALGLGYFVGQFKSQPSVSEERKPAKSSQVLTSRNAQAQTEGSVLELIEKFDLEWLPLNVYEVASRGYLDR